jgi:predicted metal-dependent hydrolase
VAPDISAGEAWRYGVDLFNARFYWEAHEAWEAVWRATSRGSTDYFATKGMIQIAASLLTLHMRRIEASRRLASRGADLLERARVGSRKYRQVDLAAVARLARERVADPAELPRLEDAAFVVELEV